MKKKSINWQTVDWQKTNTELATELGYSSRHIATKRKELGIENVPYKGFKDWEGLIAKNLHPASTKNQRKSESIGKK